MGNAGRLARRLTNAVDKICEGETRVRTMGGTGWHEEDRELTEGVQTPARELCILGDRLCTPAQNTELGAHLDDRAKR